MFGRHPRLAIDVYLGVEPEGEGESLIEYVPKMKDRLKYAYELASKEAIKAAARYKRDYDLKTRDSHLEPGDRVLVKRLAKQGKCKLADRWEKVPYIVKEQPNSDIPVYVLRREDGQGAQRVLHRNLMLPYMSLLTPNSVEGVAKGPLMKTSPKISADRETELERRITEVSSGSEEEDLNGVATPRGRLRPAAPPFVPRRTEGEWPQEGPDGIAPPEMEAGVPRDTDSGDGEVEDAGGQESTGSDSEGGDETPSQEEMSNPDLGVACPEIRRSSRIRKPPDRYQVTSKGQVVQEAWERKAAFIKQMIGKCDNRVLSKALEFLCT